MTRVDAQPELVREIGRAATYRAKLPAAAASPAAKALRKRLRVELDAIGAELAPPSARRRPSGSTNRLTRTPAAFRSPRRSRSMQRSCSHWAASRPDS